MERSRTRPLRTHLIGTRGRAAARPAAGPPVPGEAGPKRLVTPGPYIVTVRRFRLVPFVLALLIAGASAAAAGSSPRLPGLITDKGPWGPNDGPTLKPRLKAIGLHALPREALRLHIHQRMAILVNGKFVYLPAGIGIDANGKFISELHTHDSSGIIHVESPVNRDVHPGRVLRRLGPALLVALPRRLLRDGEEARLRLGERQAGQEGPAQGRAHRPPVARRRLRDARVRAQADPEALPVPQGVLSLV